MNAVRQLDSGNGNGRIVERLKAGHGGTAPFDRAMVLLNNIVKVFASPYLDVPPLRIFPSKQSQGSMTRHVAIQRHLARPSIEIRGERLAKERLCRRDTAVTAQEKVDRLSLLVDRSIEVVPFASNRNLRLVAAPGSSDGSRKSAPALLIFRHVPGDPSQDCVVGYRDPGLRRHSNEIAIAQSAAHESEVRGGTDWQA